MKKMSTIVCKIIILLLILTISLCSCAQITDILAQLNGNQSDSGNTDDSGHHTHSYAEEVTDPTCTSEGYTTYTCTCGDSYVDDKTPALSHEYNAVVTLPTCTSKGYTTYTCACGDSYTADKTTALGHNYKADVNLIPTCTDKGAVLYICQNDESHKYTEEIPANGHIDIDPKDFVCDVCDTDLCTDHIEQILESRAPTCTEPGLTEGKQCSICGEILLAQWVIPADGHKYNTVVTAPTCTKEGYTTYTCACGDSYVADKTPTTNHNYDNGKCTVCGSKDPDFTGNGTTDTESFDYSKVPDFADNNYVEINGNVPYFTSDEISNVSFESYSELDALGRVGVAFASLSKDTLPTGNRGNLSHNPTGWVQNSYPTSVVPQTQIYNRSHLIAWSLSGEDNNKQNLMTGTPYFNQIGMQIFENMVLDYIRETGNHVMYRVTPVFVGDNLLANGVLMEGWSVEDNGEGICFCVFIYNVQPGITIDYATGDNYQTPSDINGSEKKTATLVTNISDIKAGDKIIIVAAGYNYALGGTSSSGNNKIAAEITKDGNIVCFGDDVEIITLGQGTKDGTFAFIVDGGYIYAASSSKNYLKTGTSLSDNGSWKIEIASSGVATIKSTGTYTRNWIRYNSQSLLFSAYGSGQQNVCIYIVNE